MFVVVVRVVQTTFLWLPGPGDTGSDVNQKVIRNERCTGAHVLCTRVEEHVLSTLIQGLRGCDNCVTTTPNTPAGFFNFLGEE